LSNFYQDNNDIIFHMKNMDISWVARLKEDDFADKDTFPDAPKDADDAGDNYRRVLDIVGEIAGDFIAPRAASVDEEGATWEDGVVHFAKGTVEELERLAKADLLGFTLPRKYDGLNMPKVIFSAAVEMVSRADASLMNIFGLQDIGDTIYKFGSEDQKRRYLPRLSSGEVTGSMALTEPDAGSDLQSIKLTARENSNGKWRLNGVKRFITNGCAQISLVMARSEKGINGGRGISLFIYDRDENMRIRRIENKMGIHGSPTCELQFNNAEAELLGKRKMGLVKYTMSLMNGARLGIAAQALGIAEAAFREADTYAAERIQFKKPIREIMAVYEMLVDMKTSVEGGRTLLYEASRIVDIKEGLEEYIEKHPELKSDLKEDLQRYTKYAALFTPMVKGYNTEMGNKVCYDALQIHGGTGFMKEFNIERHVRDVRITNIYEGTTQLQVLASVGGVLTGVLFNRLKDYESCHNFSSIEDIFKQAQELREYLEKAVSHIKDKKDKTYQEFHSRRLVEMGTDVIISYLLCIDSLKSQRKKKVAQVFISKAVTRCRSACDFILSNDCSLIDFHGDVLTDEIA
jgi:alkylation response protein AidB-like acyl-CoA dehydrogenase